MRLIDADALIEVLQNREIHAESVDKRIAIKGDRQVVINAPTIDAVPEVAIQKAWEQGKKDAVRHGKWLEAREKDPCQYICSECKWFVDDDSKYCPNCGAKMDGERSEE